jgi:hypothetical protein
MIIAYTYEADTHCIACTQDRFSDIYRDDVRIKWTNHVDENGVWDDPKFPTLDNEGNEIHPVFHEDDWMELDESFCMENPVQKLICGDCHELLWTYTVSEWVLNKLTGMFDD